MAAQDWTDKNFVLSDEDGLYTRLRCQTTHRRRVITSSSHSNRYAAKPTCGSCTSRGWWDLPWSASPDLAETWDAHCTSRRSSCRKEILKIKMKICNRFRWQIWFGWLGWRRGGDGWWDRRWSTGLQLAIPQGIVNCTRLARLQSTNSSPDQHQCSQVHLHHHLYHPPSLTWPASSSMTKETYPSRKCSTPVTVINQARRHVQSVLWYLTRNSTKQRPPRKSSPTRRMCLRSRPCPWKKDLTESV